MVDPVSCNNTACLTSTIEHQFHYDGQETVCRSLGFVNQCTGYLFTAQIALFLLYAVYKQLKSEPLPRLSQSSKISTAVYVLSGILLAIGETWYTHTLTARVTIVLL